MLSRCSAGVRRYFCTKPTLDWSQGHEPVAKRLFELHTVEIDYGPRTDPRGMRLFELKKKLSAIPEFKGDLARAGEYHTPIVQRWQQMYNEFMNGNVKLPGRDPAGPLTFHHECDKENVSIVYDQHGRVQH